MRSTLTHIATPQPGRKAALIKRLKRIHHRKRCLILAREGPLAEALRHMLGHLFLKVEAARNPLEFVTALIDKRRPPDVAFVEAAAWDGLARLRPVNDKDPAAPIIACISRGEDDAALMALTSGADDYLAMPFDLAVLKAKLKNLGLWES